MEKKFLFSLSFFFGEMPRFQAWVYPFPVDGSTRDGLVVLLLRLHKPYLWATGILLAFDQDRKFRFRVGQYLGRYLPRQREGRKSFPRSKKST